jgi:hypothetical protein
MWLLTSGTLYRVVIWLMTEDGFGIYQRSHFTFRVYGDMKHELRQYVRGSTRSDDVINVEECTHSWRIR